MWKRHEHVGDPEADPEALRYHLIIDHDFCDLPSVVWDMPLDEQVKLHRQEHRGSESAVRGLWQWL